MVLSRSGSAGVYFAIAYLARPGNPHPKNISRLKKRPGREFSATERVQGVAWAQVFGMKGQKMPPYKKARKPVAAAERNPRRGQDPSVWNKREKLGSFGEKRANQTDLKFDI